MFPSLLNACMFHFVRQVLIANHYAHPNKQTNATTEIVEKGVKYVQN